MQAEEILTSSVRNPAIMQHILDTIDVLVGWRMGAPALIATYLLPLIRQELIPAKQLVSHFSASTVQVSRRAARLIYYDNTAEIPTQAAQQHAEKRRQLFLHAYNQLDSVLIAVAARIASARQLSIMRETEQQAWAQQTLDVYVPLMEMLGLWAHRDDLGNLSLMVLNQTLYNDLAGHALRYYKHHENHFARIRNHLFLMFEEHGLSGVQITLHDMSQASIYRKMQRARQFSAHFNLDDIGKLTVDLLVRTTRDCYTALGIIHHEWQPSHYTSNLLDERFHDYIAAPLYNGYSALTTTVLCPDERSTRPVKFRIRTHEMEEINKYGVISAQHITAKPKNAWWLNSDLKQIVSDTPPDDSIFVFTPTGEVIHHLKPGSTPVDLAFKIHSELGPYARQFRVNGEVVPHYHTLHRGDLVEIEYNLHYPSLTPDWENAARTGTARDNIRRFLKRREQSPHKGRQLIDDVLKREMGIYEMRLTPDRIEDSLQKIARRMHCNTLDALYMQIVEGSVAPDDIAATIIEEEFSAHIVLAETNLRPKVPVRISRNWMTEKASRKFTKASRVMPGVDIVGRYTGKGQGRRLVVYRADAENAPSGEDAVLLRWRTSLDLREAAEIDILAKPESFVIGMVLNAVYGVSKDNEAQRMTVHRFQSDLQETALNINMVVDAPSFEGLYRLQEALTAIQRGSYILDYKIWQLFPGQKLVLSGKQDKRQQNPYTVSKISNRSMFFGREDEISSIIEFLHDHKTPIVVSGQKRIGKTSLLYQLCENLIPELCDNIIPILFDAHSLGAFDAVHFLYELAETTYDKVLQRINRIEDRRALHLRERDLRERPFVVFARWVKRLEERLGGQRLLFVVDEFTTTEEKHRQGNLADDFFDGMQWLVDSERIGFLLCVHNHVMKERGRSWELLQRGPVVRLDTLDWQSAARLVQQPIERIYKYEPGVVDHILTLTNGHPYFVHILCQEIVKNVSRRDGDSVTEMDLERAVQVMMQSGPHYFNHLYDRHDDTSFDTLRIIAYHEEWVSRDEIQEARGRYGLSTDGKIIAKTLGDLSSAEIIEGVKRSQKVVYRIKLPVFKLWLQRHVTDQIISVDRKREN
ncbi:MAG: hypothetical protein OHK0046_40120 [Anaerolineae bacterium]